MTPPPGPNDRSPLRPRPVMGHAPFTYQGHDLSNLPTLPDPTTGQAHLKVEVTHFEQRWPAQGILGYDAEDLELQQQYASTPDHLGPPEIGDQIERYVEAAMGQELKEAAEQIKAGYVTWISRPQWLMERRPDAQCWVRRYVARGALVRIITDG